MKNKLSKLIILGTLFFTLAATQSYGQVQTWYFPTNTPQSLTNITVGSNEVFELVYVLCNNDLTASRSFTVTLGTNTFNFASLSAISTASAAVVGPAHINFSAGGGAVNIVTFKITKQVDSFVPSAGVVIPADSSGPVNLILESSTNLVSWTEAFPGTYGTSSSSRYFRLRATRN